MTKKAAILGNQPAQPTLEFIRYSEDCTFDSSTSEGLTKREYFAGLAMQGLLSDPNVVNIDKIAYNAVRCADALLEELSKE
ncbi:hypothetical protein FACS189426_06310 [Bacteroidia bacterium]|nr:hypothetical protein FACS189426_06310 [Bacteroidia bacterium]GHV71211.1 hypothetical protein FACS189420_5460 [Bacteroidia bacterium]